MLGKSVGDEFNDVVVEGFCEVDFSVKGPPVDDPGDDGRFVFG